MAARTSYSCELAWLGGDRAVADVLVEVDGALIVGVRPGGPAPPDTIRLPGLTLPGFANAHSHAFHRALRGRTHDGVGSFWTWRDQMYRLAATLDPDSYRRLARAVFAEMALAGITCVGEFHYLHHQADGTPYHDPNAMGDALLGAAHDAGIRITLLDACYLRGGIGRDRADEPPNDVQRRFCDAGVDAWIERMDTLVNTRNRPGVMVGGAVHSVRAVDPRSIERIAGWVGSQDLPLHAHVSEQPAENQVCAEAYGVTPTELLAERGALVPRFTAVHATHLTEHDVRTLGLRHASVCMCPTTERDLADGIGPSGRFRDAGVRISLGTDSHAVVDMFEEARAMELDERLSTNVRGTHGVASLLAAATADGHHCLGWDAAGRIAVDAIADLVTVDLASVRTAGTSPEHALATAIFAATATDVRHVVAGGRVVVRDGHHVEIDVARELDAAIGAVWRAVG